jgi:hypothetical protein
MPGLTLIIVCSCWHVVRSFPLGGAKWLYLNAREHGVQANGFRQELNDVPPLDLHVKLCAPDKRIAKKYVAHRRRGQWNSCQVVDRRV